MTIAVKIARSSKPTPDYQDELHAEVLDDLQIGEHGYKYRLVDGIVMPPYITPSQYHLSRTIETRASDICGTSYPKSGTNWMSNILVRLTNGGEAPADRTLRDSLHWVESSLYYPRSRAELAAAPSPRIFSSHMPFHMALGGDPLSNPCRYVYIARNPKDVAVSYYHFESGQSWSGNYNGSWSHWLQMFVDGKLQRGDWFDHVLSWWRHRDADNVHFMKYEDLRNDFDGELRRLGGFLGYDLSDETVRVIRERTGFGNMKQDSFSDMHELKALRNFFRKGVVGSWKERFTVAESEWFDEVYRERMQGSGLDFEFV
ncbi:MAG TPA: sulfotransferase domain-containing protein [Longimicrobium sp.]|nr:sulfotransferase domain-containing protein [Longimicrobium sp.]